MPSKRRKRRPAIRSRRRLKPEAVLWGLLILNVFLGAALSPLTSVRKVRVEGAASSDQARMTKVAQNLQDVPVLRLNRTLVEYRLEQDPEIERLTFEPNLFGRAVVKVVLRVPVARLSGTKSYLDTGGGTFLSAREFRELPEILAPKSAYAASLTVVDGWQAAPMAQLCQNLAAQVPNVKWKVELSERSVISLQIDSGAEVVLGSFENLPQKVAKLKSLLTEKPDLLDKVRRLNLTTPDAPMVVRG